ncbi:hypothetical protein AB0B63_30530 [Micromonospora sp. NPDC049081]|uniref:dual OB domain-containing protein n=1 Tax=Micromonospora sp. NPDC049081 TaxID=3155150 RepID=UPI0033F90F14
MPETKIIVCLANSWKNHGRCVAGVELINGRPRAWIRPVSARDGHAVDLTELELFGGGDPAPLDILKVPLLTAQPKGHQTENWLLDPTRWWSKIGEYHWSDLVNLKDKPVDLWGTGDSSGKGTNDRVAESAAMYLTSSLALIRVRELELHVFDGGFGQVKREVRAIFRYGQATYNLAVTDPVYRDEYLSRDDGRYQLGACYLTVSLAEPFHGFCYKVVAAVLGSGVPPEGNR